MVGGVGRKRAVAAANLSRKHRSLHHFSGRQRETLRNNNFMSDRWERFGLFSVILHRFPNVFTFNLFFLLLTCAISDCVGIRDKSRASFIAPGFSAGTSISIETSTLKDPGPSNGTVRYTSPRITSEL